MWGASMVKYATPLPCIGLSESDPVYIQTLSLLRKISETISKDVDLQSQEIYVDSFFFKKSLHILEGSASSVQVDILNT